MKMKLILLLVLGIALLVPTVCLAAELGVVNHVLAEKIELVEGRGFVVSGPTIIQFQISPGQAAAKHKFSVLDQIIFNAGTYKVEMRIIDDSSGQVVTNVKPQSVSVKNSPEVQTFITNWEFASKSGMYTYQIIIDGQAKAAFKISVIAAK